MYSLSAESATELFTGCCRSILRDGWTVNPRGMPTTEILGAHLVLRQPRQRLVQLPPDRVLNPAFAAAEALWILSGSDDDWIFTFNERLRHFADDGRLQGAYGPRLRRWRGHRDQLDAVRRVLEQDGSSRQAVIQLFDPARDFNGHRDVPCTLGYRFYVRNGRLIMITSMRSQDCWLGLPYDVFTTTIMHELLAGWLDVEMGNYHHVVDSLHLYDRHAERARRLPSPSDCGGQPSFPSLRVHWEDFDELLRQVIAGEPVGEPGWDDFSAVMASYRLWKQGDADNARALLDAERGLLTDALRRWYELLETGNAAIAPIPVASAQRGRRTA